MDEQTIDENRFLSPELNCRRSLIEIMRRLKSVPPTNKGFSQLHIQLFYSKYNMIDSQCNNYKGAYINY